MHQSQNEVKLKKLLTLSVIFLFIMQNGISFAESLLPENTTDIQPQLNNQKNEKIEDTLSQALDDEIETINNISDDLEKIKTWENKYSNKNYLVINKKNCMATIYTPQGKVINSFEVIIGKEIGDSPNDTLGLSGKAKNTTPAGEYILNTNIYNKSAYGDFTLSLGEKANKTKNSKKMVALHKVPSFRQKDRLNKFYDGNLKNNRMSHGCINFTQNDFDILIENIKNGFKVYILPEEQGNSLKLKKNSSGKYEFIQTKY